MNELEKAVAISKYYGSRKLNGEDIYKMKNSRVHKIYEQMLTRGQFELYENYKEAYVALFPNDRYTARLRAEKMSMFELRDTIPHVIFEQTGEFPEGYQYTLFDDFEKGDISDGNGEETQTEE